MSEIKTSSRERFRSLEEMRDEHHILLKKNRDTQARENLQELVAGFIQTGRATGALLDTDEDRMTAQSMLDYWSTVVMRTGVEPGNTNLDPFEPGIDGDLSEADFPYGDFAGNDGQRRTVKFGLDRLVRECLQKLGRNSFVVVTGGTGSGKSTVVHEGLIPAVLEGRLRQGKWTLFEVADPGSQPVTTLLEAIRPSDATPGWIREQSVHMRSDPSHLARLLDARVDGSAVILIDSFEKIFTDCEDSAQRDTLAASLLGIVKEATGGHAVILLLRNEFISYMNRLESLEMTFDQSQVVVSFTTAELRQAIEEPAKRVGLRFEEGLVDRLLLDIQGDPASAGLLRFIMYQLWERRTGCWITWDAYRQVGGGGVAMERCAESLYQAMDGQSQQLCKTVFLRLFRPEVGYQVSAISAARKDLLAAAPDAVMLDNVLTRFLDARLIKSVSAEDPAEVHYVTTHESLARHWIRLVEWLEEQRNTKKKLRHLSQTTKEWVEKNRESALLWHGSLLRDALPFLEQPETTELEREFLTASKRAELFRKYSRWVGLGVAVTGLIIALYIDSVKNGRIAEINGRIAKQRELQRDYETELGQASKAQLDFFIANDGLEKPRQQYLEALAVGDAQIVEQDLARSALWNIEAAKRAAAARRDFLKAEGLQKEFEAHHRNALEIRLKDPDLFQSESEIDEVTKERDARHADYVATFQKKMKDLPDDEFLQRRMAIITQQLPQLAGMVFHENLTSAVLSPDGSCLATAGGTEKTEVTLWRVSDLDNIAAEKSSRIAQSPVVQLAWNSDGTRLAVAMNVGAKTVEEKASLVDVLDVQDCRIEEQGIISFNPEGAVSQTAFADHSTEKRLITVSEAVDKKLKLTFWDASGSEHPPVVTALEHDRLNSLEVSRDGTRIVTATSSANGEFGAAHIWDANTGDLLQRFSNEQSASDDIDKSRSLNIAQQSSVSFSNSPRQGKGIQFASLSDDNKLLAVVSNRDVLVWQTGLPGASPPDVIFPRQEDTVTYAVFSPDTDSKTIATSCSNTVRLWKLDLEGDKKNVKLLPGLLLHRYTVYRPAFSPDGVYLATGSRDQNARIWEVATQQLAFPLLPQGGAVSGVWFAPDGWRLFSQRANLICSWSLASTNPPSRDFPSRISLDEETLKGKTLSPDGRLVITGSGPGESDISVWDTTSGDRVCLLGHTAGVAHVGFSPDSRYVVTACQDGMARIWDAKNGLLKRSLQHNGEVNFAEFSPTGDQLISANIVPKEEKSITPGSRIQCWSISADEMQNDQKDGEMLKPADTVDVPFVVSQLVLDSTGLWLVATGSGSGEGPYDKKLIRRRANVTAPFEEVQPAESEKPEELTHVAVATANGSLLIAAGSSGNVPVDNATFVWQWNKERWRRKVFIGHSSDVVHTAFSSDARRLVTSSADGTARVWDLEKALSDDSSSDFRESTTLPHKSGAVKVSAFSPDVTGKYVFTAGEEGTTRVWETASGKTVGAFPCGGEVSQLLVVQDDATAQDRVFAFSRRQNENANYIRICKCRWDRPENLKDPDDLEELLCSYAGQKWTDNGWSGMDSQTVWEKFNTAPQKLVGNPVASDDQQIVNDCLARGQLWAANWHTKQERKDATYYELATRHWVNLDRAASEDIDKLLLRVQQKEELNRFSEAELELAVAIGLRSDDPRLWKARGNFHVRRGTWNVAADDYERAIALSQNQRDWRLYEALGVTRLNLHQWAQAAQALNSAMNNAMEMNADQLDLNRIQVKLYQAQAAVDAVQRSWPDAIKNFNEALKLTPNDRELQEQRVGALVRNREWDLAIAYYQDQIKVDPSDDRHWWRLAVLQLSKAHAESIDPVEYEKTRDDVVSRFGSTQLPRAANNVAWIICLAPLPEGNSFIADKAVKLAKLAFEKSSRTERANRLNTLGAAYYRRGLYSDAIVWLTEARRSSLIQETLTKDNDTSMTDALPDAAGNYWDWLWLAMAFQMQDDPQQAPKWLQQVRDWHHNVAINEITPWSGWENELEIDFLMDEAEQLIGTSADSP